MLPVILGSHAGIVDTDTPRYFWSATLIAILGGVTWLVQPGYVQGLVEYGGYTDQQAGYLVAAEMLGFAISTLVVSLGAKRINWRIATASMLLISITGNLLSAAFVGAAPFIYLRLAAGLGTGGLISIGFASLGLCPHPEKAFGYMCVWSLVYAAAVMFAMPTVFQAFGVESVLILFAALLVTGLPALRNLPVSGTFNTAPDKDAVALPYRFQAITIASLFLYFMAMGGIWAYLFRIGVAAGLSEQTTANGLTISQFGGMIGGLMAAFVANRFGHIPMLGVGVLGAILPLTLFALGPFGLATFFVGVFVYNLGFNLQLSYIYSVTASFDPTGRVTTYGVSAQTLGFTAGPAAAALILRGATFATLEIIAIFVFVASLLLIVPPILKHRVLRSELRSETPG